MFRFGKRSRAAREEAASVDVSEKNGVRSLHLGSDAIQSSMRLKDPYELVLGYSRCMFAFLLFREEPADMVLIGLGGGSITKFVHRYMARTRITSVELSAQVVQVARSLFFLPPDDARHTVVVGDGADYINRLKKPVDVIFLDAYSADGIVQELSSEPFFCRCREQLNPEGVLVVNLWGTDPMFSHYLERLAQVFDGLILCLPARQRGNVATFCFNRGCNSPTFEALGDLARRLEQQYPLEFREFVPDLKRMNLHNERRLQI